MSFFALPPEVNSALLLGGAGPEPLLATASAWEGLSAELATAAASFSSVTSGLVSGSWQGASAAAMAAAAAPYAGWLSAAAASAESSAVQARAVAAAFESVVAAAVHPGVIAANRSQFVSLALSNIFGQNAPAIAATEFAYESMWAQDVAAMAGYHLNASALVAGLQPFTRPAQLLGGVGGLSTVADSIAAAAQGIAGGRGSTVSTGTPVASTGPAPGGVPGILGQPGTGFVSAGVARTLAAGAAGAAAADLGLLSLLNPGNPLTGFLNATGPSFDIFPITLPLELNVAGAVGPITIEPIQILPTIPLNFHQTFLLGPLTVPPIHVPAIPLVDFSIPIDIGPLTVSPITLVPAIEFPSQIITIAGFNLVPGGIQTSGLWAGPLFLSQGVFINPNVNPIAAQLSYTTPALTLFPGGLSIPDAPLHFDVGIKAGTGAFTIPGFSLPEHAIPLTISTAGQIDGFSTPRITIDAIPASLDTVVRADRVVPLFPLPSIPLTITANGTVGPVHVAPIAIPQAHAAITNATVSIGSFTVPEIAIPQIPLHVTGTVALAQNSISSVNLLDPLNLTGQLQLGPISGPNARIDIASMSLGSGLPSLVLRNINVAVDALFYGPETLNLATTPLALPDISIPAQNIVTLGLGGGINPMTLFPGGLAFPENSVSLTNFSVGSDPFTVFPDGFRIDQFPFKINATVLSPTPVPTTGSIGPIHIPAAPLIQAVRAGGSGNINLNLGLPTIPTPAIGLGLNGLANYGFVTHEPIVIPPFGTSGTLATEPIGINVNIGSIPFTLRGIPVIGGQLEGNVFAFVVNQGIDAMTVPLDFMTSPIAIPPLSLGGSIPIDIPLDIVSAATIPGIGYTQSIPLNFATEIPQFAIPETLIPAIPIGSNLALPGSIGPQLGDVVTSGATWLQQQLMNAGLGNAGVYNFGSGNLGNLNLGNGNIGSYNLGGGNIGDANIGWGNGALGTLLGKNVGFGNAGSGNFGFGNAGSGNIGFGNTGTGNVGIGLVGDNQNGFGGWNSGTGNIGLFNSGTNNVGFFNSGNNNIGIGNSGLGSTGLFNAGNFSSGLGNAGERNLGFFNAGNANLGAFNPGNVNSGLFNSGDGNVGLANSGDFNDGILISGDHSIGALFTGDYQNVADPNLGITLLDINQNLGPVHIDPIHVPGLPININETIYINSFTVPQIDVPAIPVEIHQGVALPAITLFEGLNMPAQQIVIPLNIPASTGSTLQLPAIGFNAQYKPDNLPPWSFGQFAISQQLNTLGPTAGILVQTGATDARTGAVTLNLPAINIPRIATSPIPLTIDTHGGIPAFTLFPGGLSIPQNPIPVTYTLTGGLQPFTIFPDGYTIDPIPLHLHLDATLLNPIDGIPPSLNLVDFQFSGGMGPVKIPDLPIPTIPLGLNFGLSHGAFTIPPIELPNIPIDITGDIGLGPIGIPSQAIPTIFNDPLATVHFDAFKTAVTKISPFVIWTSGNAPWDPIPAPTGAYISIGSPPLTDLLFVNPLVLGSATQDPYSIVFSGGTYGFNTPAVMIDKIPLGFRLPGGVDGATIFPNGLTFPANNLVDLNLGAGPKGFTIPARTIPAIQASLDAIVKLATPDNLLPPYKLLYVTANGGIGPAVLPSFHIPSIPLGFDLGGGIGPITIPSFSTPPVHLGLDPSATAGPVSMQPISIPRLTADAFLHFDEIKTGLATTTGAIYFSGGVVPQINLGGSSTSTTPAWEIPWFTVSTPPGGIPGFSIPVDPIELGLPLSVTIPSLTFPGLTIPRIPLGQGLSGALPAFDLPSITIDRIPISFAGPLTLF
nr:PPE family protein [Mycobacterium sp. Z3061]